MGESDRLTRRWPGKKAKEPAPSWSRGGDLLGLEEETDAVPQQRLSPPDRPLVGWGGGSTGS